MKSDLLIIIPAYNEEENIENVVSFIQKKYSEYDYIVVNDGSKDHTWNMIDEFHKMDFIFSGVKLSRNRGHQNALLAGLTMASEKADIVISMDADLQDDINAVDQMIEKYYEGCDIVYGVRSARDTDTFFKRFTAEAFYKLINKMGGELV